MDLKFLQNTALFKGLSEEETKAILTGLKCVKKEYIKNDIIMNAGCTTDKMGVVLLGSVTIENNDLWGNKTILSHVGPGGFFAETYGLLQNEPMLVDVVANEACRICFLCIGNLQELASSGIPGMVKLMTNLLTISAHKNMTLSGRSFHTAAKTIRGRVMSYLNSLYIRSASAAKDPAPQTPKKTELLIPFDRQQLADYLNVERTALSKKFGRMQKEGLIRFRKNRFVIEQLCRKYCFHRSLF